MAETKQTTPSLSNHFFSENTKHEINFNDAENETENKSKGHKKGKTQ